MPKQSHEPSRRAKRQLSTEGFFDKYADLFAESFPTPGHVHPTSLRELAGTTITPRLVPFLGAMHQLEVSGFSGLLQAAQRENDPGAGTQWNVNSTTRLPG